MSVQGHNGPFPMMTHVYRLQLSDVEARTALSCVCHSQIGMPYAFWSAHAVTEEHTALKAEAQELGVDWHDLREERQEAARLARVAADAALLAAENAAGRDGVAAVAAARATRVLGVEELLSLMEEQAAAAVAAAGPNDPRVQEGADRRYMVSMHYVVA
jgi:hypothetical protein